MEFIQTTDKSNINIDEHSIYIVNARIDLERFFEKITYKKNIRSISLRLCFITKIPNDLFKDFVNLETIDLCANSIEAMDFIIPDTVTTIDVSYNRIKYVNIPGKIGGDFPIPGKNKLEYINLSYNFLINIPECIKDIKHDIDHNNFDIIRVFGNPVIGNPVIGNPVIGNPVNVGNGNPVNVVGNVVIGNPVVVVNGDQIRDKVTSTNVHESDIQNQTLKFIKNMLTDIDKDLEPEIEPEPNYIEKIKEMFLKKEKLNFFTKYFSFKYYDFKYLLSYYNNDPQKIVYNYSPYATCTMSQIIERIYSVYLKSGSNKENIIENLYIQMKDGLGYCFVGRYTRLVNTVGLISISKNDQIANKIIYLQTKTTDIDVIKNEVKELMTNLCISREDQKPWLDSIENLR